MRIYTEVNFIWDDKQGKLVETSSESFDHSGDMALCDRGEWHTQVYYDANGDEWTIRGQEGWFSEIGYIEYLKNGVSLHTDDSPPGDNAWSNQLVVFEDWALHNTQFSHMPGKTSLAIYKTKEEWIQDFSDTY